MGKESVEEKSKKCVCVMCLQRGHTSDNFAQFGGNDSLTQTVEHQSHLVDHFTGVLSGTVHSDHSRRLLRAVVLLNTTVQRAGQGKLGKVLDNRSVNTVVSFDSSG